MTEQFSLDQIREFWTQQALKHGQSPAASWSDRMVIEMEIRQILDWLEDGDRVLDVGCANGYSTLQFAARKKIRIRGLDSVPEMVEESLVRLKTWEGPLCGSVEFGVGDIRDLKEPADSYDKVVVIRVVISLREWDRQRRALRECARVLKPGGLLLLSEATLQGWSRLNQLRREWGLPDIPVPPFNLYLDQERVIESLAPELDLIQLSNFASTYYVGTRVLKPLLIRALGLSADPADPTMEWNRWLAEAPAWGDYGTQKLFVFRKK